VTIHLNIRDTLFPPAVLAGDTAHIGAARALQENEDYDTYEEYKGQHR